MPPIILYTATDFRKQCLHCGCGRSSHTIETELSSIIPLIGGLTLGDDSSKLTRADIDRLRKYAWYPPGLGHGMVSGIISSFLIYGHSVL